MQIAIVGAAGHGRETLQAARRSSGTDRRSPAVDVIGFYDDGAPDMPLLDALHACYLSTVAEVAVPCLIGIGNGPVKELIAARVEAAPAVIDPLARVGDDVELGAASVVFAQATVTTNVRIGRHAHIGRGAAVGHDSVVGDYACVMPLAAISGNVVIGDRAFIGTGALIRQGVNVGADAVVGTGAVVLKDVPAGATVVGNPARQR